MLHIDASDLAGRLPRLALIDAIEAAFRAPGIVPDREHYAVATLSDKPGTLLLMPAWRVGRSIGVKVATIFPDNAHRRLPAVAATYLLLDATTGTPRALLDGAELTLRRTGAASALAARYLARPDSHRLLMVGAGKLAPHLIESHAAVRPIREVRIWGRRREPAHELAASLRHLPITVAASDDLESDVRWADIVSCATLSREPLVRGAWLTPGQHLDLVGAFTPQMCEADGQAVALSEVFVDTRSGANGEAGDLLRAIAQGLIEPGAIRADLFDLPSGRFRRSGAGAITLFKSVGTALEDLAAAELAVDAGPA